MHLCTVYLAFSSAFTHEFENWERVLPPGDALLKHRLAAVNTSAMVAFGATGDMPPCEYIAERAETFLRVTEGLAPDTPVAAPWYGEQVVLTLSTATGLLLSESLLHGLDISRGTRLPWTIGPDEARLVVAVANGTATVTLDALRQSPCDCRITAAPVPFLLTTFRRTPVWKAIARGQLKADGRKPWLAPHLAQLIPSP